MFESNCILQTHHHERNIYRKQLSLIHVSRSMHLTLHHAQVINVLRHYYDATSSALVSYFFNIICVFVLHYRFELYPFHYVVRNQTCENEKIFIIIDIVV